MEYVGISLHLSSFKGQCSSLVVQVDRRENTTRQEKTGEGMGREGRGREGIK